MNDVEKALVSIIGRGERHAIKQDEITRLTGLSARETREVIERLRAGGMVICSSNAGRFLPETVEELEAYVRRIQASVRAECVALAPARRLLKEWKGDNHA
jgi:DNA-binding GntR family transcriptional regulator